MSRTSPTHYIAPSSISVTPNANQSANDLAVYVARGAKIKVYSPRAGINMVDSTYQEWTLTGRNRRLAESEKPYTIYARLQKNDKSKGYLVFAPKNGNAQDGWTDKYNYVTTEGWTHIAGASPAGDYYYIRLGEVSLPENNERTVDLDTGILDTDDFNNNWAASPDAMPLRVELGCTINDEDAGPTPYVYWGQSIVLTASLVEGWTGTDIERFDHWEITRDTHDTDADDSWNHPTGAGSYRGMTNGSITLSHARGANDDFNGSVSAVFTVTAMERIEDENNPGNPTYEPLVSETINIHAETLEKYELVLSSRIVSFNPTSETYNPAGGVAVRVRATDQSGYVFDLTTNQITNSGIAAQYAIDGSSTWTTLTFVSDPGTGAGVATISTTPSTTPFAAQKNVNMRILSAGGEVLFSDSISYLRDGEDSKEREWIFLRSINPITFVDAPGPYQKPALISLGEVNPPNRAANSDDDNKNQDGWVPNGWWDEQQGADEDHPYEYGAYRDFVRSASGNAGEGESTGGQWGSFTDPKIWSHYGGDAVTYDIVPSVSIINADAAGHVSSDGIIIQAFRIKGSERSGNILPPTTGSAYYVEYSIDGGTWTQCAMFSYQPEGEVAVQRYGIAPLSVKQAQTDIALRLKNSADPNEVLKENPPIKVVNIVSEEETQAIVEEVGDARFFRKDQADSDPHLATFGDVHVEAGLSKGSGAVSSGSLEVDGDASVAGDTELNGDVTIGASASNEAIVNAVMQVLAQMKSQNYVDDNPIGKGGWNLLSADDNGNSYMVIDKLFVRLKAIFNELEIRKISYAGGNIIFSHAGSEIVGVKPLYRNGAVYAYRCYCKKDDGTTATENWWKVDDQAKCQTFNIQEGVHQNVENTYYWRKVIAVGSEIASLDGTTSEELYNYADLSLGDCDANSDIPKAGDSIIQMGNRTDTERQGFISLEVFGSDAPAFKVYKGVNGYNLNNKMPIVISPKDTSMRVQHYEIETDYGVFPAVKERGEWDLISNHRCYYFDRVQHNGSSWLCTYPQGSTPAYTTEEPSVNATYWKVDAQAGESAPSYTEEWYAWSNVQSVVNATTEPTPNGGWYQVIGGQGEYAYLWKKLIRYTWNSATRVYVAGTEQYFRMSGTNGTSISVKGSVATVADLPSTHADGDAYVVEADHHLYMWSDESRQWLDIGEFKGEDGKTYYTHIAWATSVTTNPSTGEVTNVTGFTIAKTADDTTHLWMGVYVDENSAADPDDALLYTWSYTKGVDGASITKQNESKSYALSNSGTVTPSSWQSTKPSATTDMRWIWTRTVILWSDGSETTLYQAERDPNDGAAGQDIIVDGSTEMKYYVGTSNTTHPAEDSSDWKDLSQVTQEQGKYLWCKATTWYRKSTSASGSHDAGKTVTYDVNYIARDGAPGSAGRGVTDVTEYYKATASNTPLPTPSSDTGWSTDPNLSDLTDKWNEQHPYLWNYEKVAYSSAPLVERTTPQILAIWTKDGAAGKGIDSFQNYYKCTNSSTAPSRPQTDGTDGWSNTPVAPTDSLPYLWNYEKITWVNPSGTTYTDVQMIGHYGKDADVWTIGNDGYWYCNGVKTNTKAEGTDGTGVEIKGGVDVLFNADKTSQSQTSLEGLTGMTVGECYTVTSNKHLYFYDGTTAASAANPSGWRDLGKFSGDDGVSSYMHIAYADDVTFDAQGHPTSCTGFTVTKQKEAYDWMGLCTNNSQTDPTTYTAYEWNKVKGAQGSNGETPAFLYRWADSASAPTVTAANYVAGTNLGGWSKTAPNKSTGHLWMSQQILLTSTSGTYSWKNNAWSTPVNISGEDGDPGADAKNREWIYKRLTTYPFSGTAPANITKDTSGTTRSADYIATTDDFVPQGWNDNALPATESEKYVYSSYRDFDTSTERWGAFSTPVLWSNWGVQGIDGDGVQYVYKLFDHELTDAERTSNIPTKPASMTDGEWIPSGWNDDPLAPTLAMQYCYCSIIKKINGAWASTFEKLGLWSRFSEDGKSAISSISLASHDIYFARNNSGTTAPLSGWGTDTLAPTAENKYVWRKDVYTYDSQEYGRNIMRGTATPVIGASGAAKWSNGQIRISQPNNGSISVSDEDLPDIPGVTSAVIITETASGQVGFCQDVVPLKAKRITQSCWIKGDAGVSVALQPAWISNVGVGSKTVTCDGTWQRVECSGTVPEAKNWSIGYVYLNANQVGKTLKVAGMKVEYGDEATDWCIAPEDLNSEDVYVWAVYGENAVQLTLDNQHEDFLYSDDGTIVAPSAGATSQAHLFDGSVEKTSSVSEWRISDNNGSSWSTGSNSTATASISSGGLLTVTGLKAATAVIKVRAKYNNIYYYADFTANKTSQDRYELKTTPSSIAFNADDSWVDKTISLSAERTDLQGGKSTPSISTTANSGNLRVFTAWVNSNGSLGTLSRLNATTKTIGSSDASTYMGIYFELRWYFNSSTADSGAATTYRVCDFETVEIAKTANGATGPTGKGIVLDLRRDNYTEAQWNSWCTIGNNGSWSKNTDYDPADLDFTTAIRVGDYFTISGTATDSGLLHASIHRCTSIASSTKIYGTCTSHVKSGENGTSSYVADIDNEMDAVQTDDKGYSVKAQSVTTTAKLYYGNTARTFKTAVSGYTSGTAKNGVTVTWNNRTTAASSDTITFAFATTAKFTTGKMDFDITLTDGTDTSVTRTVHFTVNGIAGDVYNIDPSVSEIVATRDASGNYLVNGSSTYTMGCKYTKDVDGVKTYYDVASDGSVDGKYYVFRALRRRSDQKWQSYSGGIVYDDTKLRFYYRFTGTGKDIDLNTFDAMEIFLCAGGSGFPTGWAPANGETEMNILDRELVYVVANGENGTSPLIIDTDNDADQFGTDASGATGSTAQNKTANVTMYYGSTAQSLTGLTATVYLASAPTTSIGTATTTGTSVSGNVTIGTKVVAFIKVEYTGTVGTVTLQIKSGQTINGDFIVKILGKCDRDMTGKEILFTVQQVKSGAAGDTPIIYQLHPSEKVFAFGRTDMNELTPASIVSQIGVEKTEGNTSTIINTTVAGLTYSWGFDSEAAKQTGRAIGTSITVTKANAEAHRTVWIQLYNNSVAGDKETLPITKDGKADKPYAILRDSTYALIRDNLYNEESWNTYCAEGHTENWNKRDWDADFDHFSIGDTFIVTGYDQSNRTIHFATFLCTAVTSTKVTGICYNHFVEGDAGMTGNEPPYLHDIETLYALSDSDTIAPVDTQQETVWGATRPSPTTEKRFVWQKDCYTYTESEKGRNIMRGTATPVIGTYGTAKWENAQIRVSGGGNGTMTIDSSDIPDVPGVTAAVVLTETVSGEIGCCQDVVPMKAKTITQSCWVKGASGVKARLMAAWISNVGVGAVEFTCNGSWQRVQCSGTIPEAKNWSIGYIYIKSGQVGKSIAVAGMKVEYGSTPTDWSQAPEDYYKEDVRVVEIAGKDAPNLGENLINVTGEPFVITSSTSSNYNNATRWYATPFKIDGMNIPDNTPLSGQMKIKIEGCSNFNARELFLYLSPKSTGGYPRFATFNPTENGTYVVKKENFTINSSGNGWSNSIYFAWSRNNDDLSFGTNGKITIEDVKLEIGDRCTAWSLSEHDKTAVSVYLESPVTLFTQDINNTSTITPLPSKTNIIVKKGGTTVPLTDYTVAKPSSGLDDTHCTYSVTNTSNEKSVTISAIGTYAEGGNNYYYENGFARVNVTYEGSTYVLDYKFLLNAMGKFKTVIEGDVETSIANKTWYEYNPATGQYNKETTMGEFIRSSSQNTSKLTDKTNGAITSMSEILQRVDGISFKVYDDSNVVDLFTHDADISIKSSMSSTGTIPTVASSANVRTICVSIPVTMRRDVTTSIAMQIQTKASSSGSVIETLVQTFPITNGVLTTSNNKGRLDVLEEYTDSNKNYLRGVLYFEKTFNNDFKVVVVQARYTSNDAETVFLKSRNFLVGGISMKAGLKATGIDIEAGKIINTADRWECQTNNGVKTAWLDDMGNFTIRGVYNNLITVIDSTNVDKYIIGIPASNPTAWYLDVLLCGTFVKLEALPSGFSGMLKLPYYANDNLFTRGYTRYLDVSTSTPRQMTSDELRMLAGRKMVISWSTAIGANNDALGYVFAPEVHYGSDNPTIEHVKTRMQSLMCGQKHFIGLGTSITSAVNRSPALNTPRTMFLSFELVKFHPRATSPGYSWGYIWTADDDSSQAAQNDGLNWT